MKRYNVIYEVTTVGVCLKYKKNPPTLVVILQFMFNLLKCANFVLEKIKKRNMILLYFSGLSKIYWVNVFRGGIGFGFTYLHFSRSGVSVPSKKSLRLFESVLTSQTPPNVCVHSHALCWSDYSNSWCDNVVDRGRRGLAGARGRSYRRQTMPGRGVPHYLHPLPGGNGKLSQSRY